MDPIAAQPVALGGAAARAAAPAAKGAAGFTVEKATAVVVLGALLLLIGLGVSFKSVLA